MKRHHIKRLIASVLLATTLITAIPDFVYAELGGLNSGISFSNPGSVPASSNSAKSSIIVTKPWLDYSSIDYIGYRLYCIDNSENLCTNVLDVYYRIPRLSTLYSSTYNENLVTPTSDFKLVPQSTLNAQGINLPLAILATNPLATPHNFVYDSNRKLISYEVDPSKYLSTALRPERTDDANGIIKWVTESLGNTESVNNNKIISSTQNANADANGSKTQGSTGQSNSSSISNTGNAETDKLVQRIARTIRSGNKSQYRSLIQEVANKGQLFDTERKKECNKQGDVQ